jgi:hypothetical protein
MVLIFLEAVKADSLAQVYEFFVFSGCGYP